jgi:hypothetical protein
MWEIPHQSSIRRTSDGSTSRIDAFHRLIGQQDGTWVAQQGGDRDR